MLWYSWYNPNTLTLPRKAGDWIDLCVYTLCFLKLLFPQTPEL